MYKYLLLFFTLTGLSFPALSNQLFLLEFDLTSGESLIGRGKTTVSKTSHSWNRGLSRSYLKLRCNKLPSGKTEKLLNTVDLFAGLVIIHELAGDKINIKVKYTQVQPRLQEIRALPKNKCEDMSPIFTSVTDTFTYKAEPQKDVTQPFGNGMLFRVNIIPLKNL